jgi:hypothetical protein
MGIGVFRLCLCFWLRWYVWNGVANRRPKSNSIMCTTLTSHQITDVTADVAILAPPIRMMMGVKAELKRKLAVIYMFLLRAV